ncbi:achaete-scute homolog 3-like [Symsagittifera roscoffensis]|uniref:achaete-scute homolog 3-like n=1 Tax=Symsagittifera roscoffensis TaxID=84072 RepID=UPI00307C149C
MVSAPYGVDRELSPNFIYQMEGIFPTTLQPGTNPYFTAHGTSIQVSSAPSPASLITDHLPSYYSSVQQNSAFFRPYAIPSRVANLTTSRQNGPAVPVQGTPEPSFLRKRNERERQRVKCVNEGYTRLRNHLPNELAEKRLSKVETLRAAIRYIEYLQDLLDSDEKDPKMHSVKKRSFSFVDEDSRDEKENEEVPRRRICGKSPSFDDLKDEVDAVSPASDRSQSWNSPTDFLSQEMAMKHADPAIPSDNY